MSAPGWGDAGVIVPWVAYMNYADEHLVREHYPAAKKWIDYIQTHSTGHIWTDGRGNDYGDWLNSDTLKIEGLPPVRGELSKEAFATACAARSAQIVSMMALVAGRQAEGEAFGRLATDIGAAWAAKYSDAESRIEGDTQAGYALALHWGLAPTGTRAAIRGHLLRAIAAYDGHLSTGFQSTLPMMMELSLSGRADEAYRLVLNRTPPSWAYMIDQGATTMWERWDGYVKGRGFQDPGMNSLNHFAFGAVGEWVWRTIAGINPGGPGFHPVSIHPVPGGGVDRCRASFKSIRGTIEVEWTLRDGAFEMDLLIPPSTSANVSIPAPSLDAVTEGGRPLAESEGITIGGRAGGRVAFGVASGRYHFVSRLR
jgi:alpha-L-rhamnosidase